MEVTVSSDERNGVTLVEVDLWNDSRTHREVRIENRLDGPVLPPRRDGYPVDGWDGNGYVGVVRAGDRVGLGFAVPAPAVDPPIEVVEATPIDDFEERHTPEGIVRDLGDPRPPAEAVCEAVVGGDQGRESPASPSGESMSKDSVGSGPSAESIPPAIAAWFDAMEAAMMGDEAVDVDGIAAVADRAHELCRRCEK